MPRFLRVVVLLTAAACTTQSTVPISQRGRLGFQSYALSASAAACARAPAASRYLEQSIIREFLDSWAQDGHTIEPEEFLVEIEFALDVSGALVHLDLIGESRPGAGEKVISSFKRASPFPALPEATECLAGELYRFRIEHILQAGAS